MKMLNIKTLRKNISLIIVSTLISTTTFAETSVIVHPSNTDDLSSKLVQRLFLGKTVVFPNGKEAIPLERKISSEIKNSFNAKVLKKTQDQLNAYWAKRVFTGKGIPPKTVIVDSEIVEIIANNVNTISYVDSASVDDSVKVIYKF